MGTSLLPGAGRHREAIGLRQEAISLLAGSYLGWPIVLASTATTVLDYVRVLIWPALVIGAVIWLREPIKRIPDAVRVLFEGRKVSALRAGPIGLDLEQAQIAATESTEDAPGPTAPGTAVDTMNLLNLLQLFEVQLVLLRELRKTPAGLPKAAAVGIIRDAFVAKGLKPEDFAKFDDDAHTTFLVARGLVVTQDDVMRITPAGQMLLDFESRTWYAAKAY
jgi:hypothetical protein